MSSTDEFNRDSGNRDLLSFQCKECKKADQRQRWRTQSDEKRERHRLRSVERRYGLTPVEYDALLSAQNGVCGICGGPQTGKNWHVDHDHETGKVRGILCNGCNCALGNMRDDPKLLRAAADYLEKHGKR
jgi:hypothetical protein